MGQLDLPLSAEIAIRASCVQDLSASSYDATGNS